jgi:Tfp pilus assembly protein PilO
VKTVLTRFQYATLAVIYGLAILVFGLLVYPALTEESAKVADLAQHRKQKEQLDIKLKEKLRIDKEKQTLVADIASLRNAVPKEANIDLLLIDLERLAKQANVDLIGFETPGTEDVKETHKEINQMLEDLKDKQAAKPKPKDAKPAAPAAGAKPADIGSELGLKQIDKEVYVTGDYSSMVQFVRNIEAYERVMGVSHVVIAVPKEEAKADADKASERAKKLKLNQPVMCFLLSVYYLP